MPGPLEGIRVLDLSRVLAGPWATQSLADMGAEVIKVERPQSGDEARGFGPPFLNTKTGPSTKSVYFLAANRGKRSVTIDVTKPEGRNLVIELAERSDIFIENFKVGTLTRLGLDYAALSRRNPRLVYCSITGFGQTGPHRHRPGYDLVVQAMGGLMSITGEPDGEPIKSGVAIADILTGLYATSSILAALYHRERTNEGQYIDLALLDVQIATLANQATSFLITGQTPRRHGNAHANICPYQTFATSDGRMIVAVANDLQFKRFAAILGAGQLADDAKFQTNAARVQNRDALVSLISERMLQKTTEQWLKELDRAEIPAGPVNDLDEVFRDPQVAARDLIVEFPPEEGTNVRVVGSPMHFSRTAVSYALPPPGLGEHTDEVLTEVLNKNASDIQKLRDEGVI
jgi:crotonobetainyl-CoA:carnitine CoA-transferase CaiB-like acyl-CoA transferase